MDKSIELVYYQEHVSCVKYIPLAAVIIHQIGLRKVKFFWTKTVGPAIQWFGAILLEFKWALLSDDEDDFAALVGKIVQDFGDQTSGAFTEIFY